MKIGYDDKPTATERGLFNTMAEVSVAMRALGDSEDRILRVSQGMSLAWLEMRRHRIRPARVPAARAVVEGEVTEEDWGTGGA